MEALIDFFQYPFALRALYTSMLVGLMCGILGTFIVLRNMSMIGDALSHAILPGVVIAALVVGYSTIGFFLGAVIAGLLAAIFITWIQQSLKTKNDAAIGIVFTCMFALGVIGISYISKNLHMHIDLKDFLFGSALGISNEDIYLTTMVTIFVITSIVVLYRHLQVSTFQPIVAQTMGTPTKWIHYYLMLLLSLAVVAALRSVGVILVVAMLITPSSAALLLSHKLKSVLYISGLIGILSALLGLILAVVLETPPGPMMAVIATGIYLLAAVLSPRQGLLQKSLKQLAQKNNILREDILKETFKLGGDQPVYIEQLSEALDLSNTRLRFLLKKLIKTQELELTNSKIKLLEKGLKKSEELVRAHRLWETYMVDRMGLSKEQIHAEAERIEHYLPSDLVEEIEAELGYPMHDPHGAPIPNNFSQNPPTNSLAAAALEKPLVIENAHYLPSVTKILWENNILSGDVVYLLQKNKDGILIKHKESTVHIPIVLAKNIKVSSHLTYET